MRKKHLFAKVLPVLLSLLLGLRITASHVQAGAEFLVNQHLTYHFEENGNCHVNYQITLKNKLSRIYATQYAVTFSGNNIKNIAVFNQEGEEIKFETKQPQRGLTTITVHFPEKVVGKNKEQSFNIQYQTADYARKEGQIWRITTPKINNLTEIDSLILSIEVPLSFGKLSFISPKNYQYRQEGNLQVIQFNKEALSEKEIMAVFGESQTFAFRLKYYLKNDEKREKEALVALPPDTGYQKIYLHQISPQPKDVVLDKDGNWLAVFSILPEEEINILVEGKAQISATPSSPPLETDINSYLKSETYWEADDPEIKQKAQELKTVEKIYQFVVQHLSYDTQRVEEGKIERWGAKKVLSSPDHAICSEFTDLFIALARAAGIPAREINGYAYSDNPQLLPLSINADVLHSWPEFWDKKEKVWRQVDPTWENTSHIDYFNKMDMTHLAFVIHGQDSRQPAPAGAYRQPNSKEKSVAVVFSSPEKETLSSPQINIDIKPQILPGKKEKGTLTVYNPGPTALYHLKLTIEGKKLSFKKEETITALPPFGQKTVSFEIANPYRFIGKNSVSLIASLENEKGQTLKEEKIPLTLMPIVSLENLPQLSLVLAGLLFFFSLLIAIVKIKKRK